MLDILGILLRDHPKDQSYLMHLVEGKSKLDGKRVRGALFCCSVHSIPPPTITIWFFSKFLNFFLSLTSLCWGTNPSEIARNWPKASIRLANKICAKDELKPLLDFFFFFNFPPKLLLDGTIFGCGKKPPNRCFNT